MSQLFQITEEDLAQLESTLPKLADRLLESMDNPTRVQIRRVQRILMNVRWSYGPPSEVGCVPAEDISE